MYRKMLIVFIWMTLLSISIVPTPFSRAQDDCDVIVYGAIGEKWTALGGPDSPLGCPVAEEGDINGGRAQDFENGVIAWKNRAPEAFAVYSPIADKWTELNRETGPLGYPTSDPADTTDGNARFNRFELGWIFDHSELGVVATYGAIGVKWDELGGIGSPLGYPVSDEEAASIENGRFSEFQRGAIYWRPVRGAFAVQGALLSKWTELEREAGPLGFPTSDEIRTPDGVGRYNIFDQGWIYWHPDYGPQAVYGVVGQHWYNLGAATSTLGYPVEDNQMTADGLGEFLLLENGMIMTHPTMGAKVIYGDIAAKYLELDAEAGPLGYPIQDSQVTSDGEGSYEAFENGMIYWHPDLGAFALAGDILDTWNGYGAETSFLGYPVSDAATLAETDGQFSEFENGSIRVYADDSVQTLLCKTQPNNYVTSDSGELSVLVSGQPVGSPIDLATALGTQLASFIPNAEIYLIEQLTEQIDADTDLNIRDLEVQLNSSGNFLVNTDQGYLFLSLQTQQNFVRLYINLPTDDDSEAEALVTIYFDLEFSLALQIPTTLPGDMQVTLASTCLHYGDVEIDVEEVAVSEVMSWFDAELFGLEQEKRLNDALLTAELTEMNDFLTATNEGLNGVASEVSHTMDITVDENTGRVTLILTPDS